MRNRKRLWLIALCLIFALSVFGCAEIVPVTGVELDRDAISLELGGTDTLKATVLPENAFEKAVVWSSSDESVATVEGGVVTAVAEGDAVITVKTKDGGFTDTCAVKVVRSLSWDGVTPESKPQFFEETEEGYTVGDAAALAYFAKLVNEGNDFAGKVVRLTVSPDLKGFEWTPIGQAVRTGSNFVEGSTPFAGVFDGGNNTISNLKITFEDAANEDACIGLFGAVAGESAAVRNLKVAGADVKGLAATGILAGAIKDATIENCEVRGAADGESTGGIAGRVLGGTVKNCTNYAAVTGSGKAGGITSITYDTDSNSATLNNVLEDCVNYGTVVSVYAGGIAGYPNNADIINCTNEADLEAAAQTLGGIAGSCFQSRITGAVNRGSVTNLNVTVPGSTQNADGSAGGIAGYAQDSTGSFGYFDCVNYGDVSGKRAGGIFGDFSSNLKNCVNHGTVTGTEYTGGLAGSSNGLTIDQCTNNGVVNGAGYTGGLVGHSSYNFIKNSENNGAVTATGDDVGGIAGTILLGQNSGLTPGGSAYYNCANTAKVVGRNNVGGIVGRSDYTFYTVEGCENSGEVTGVDKVGGVIGWFNGSANPNAQFVAGFRDCGNLAKVTGESNVGGFAGVLSLGTVGGNTAVSGCFTTATEVNGNSLTGAFAGATMATTADTAIENCSYAYIAGLPAVAEGAGTANIRPASYTVSQDGKEISLADEGALRYFAQLVSAGEDFAGKTVRLTADVVLAGGAFAPIGVAIRDGGELDAQSKVFRGVFDGANHTITGLTIAAADNAMAIGLFSGLSGQGAAVKNLKLAQVAVSAPAVTHGTGAVVGLMNDRALIENCHVLSGTIEGYQGLGGVNGRTLKTGVISGCTNAAAVTGNASSYNVGGISGAMYYDQDKTGTAARADFGAVKCVNSGAIMGNYGVAGIVGLSTTASVTDCENTGAVVSVTGTSSGGIVGEMNCGGTIVRCVNRGTVTATVGSSGNFGLGGVVGWIRYNNASGAYSDSLVASVIDCENHADVTGLNNGVGGIVGELYWAGTVTGCVNSGSISNADGNMTGGVIGGIQFGDMANYSETRDNTILVENCSSTAASIVSKGTNTATVVGHLYVPTDTPAPTIIFRGCTASAVDGLGTGIPAELDKTNA